MIKLTVGLASAVCLLAGCATSPQTAGTQPAATGGQSTASTAVNSASGQDGEGYRTVYVPPPVGSMLGGGYVRVASDVKGNDENALLAMINQLNAAAGDKTERPYVIEAVSHSTGVSRQELQAQQDILRLQFGQLCAINAIARGNSNKVQEIATLKAKGKTWTQLATSNGISIATVVQTTRNANELTKNSYLAYIDRVNGGLNKVNKMNIPSPSRSVLPGGG